MRRILTVVCVLAVVLTGCGSADAPTPTASLATPLPGQSPAAASRTVVRFALLDWEAPIYESAIADFEQDNPDIDVQIVSTNEVLGFGSIASIQYPEDAAERLVAAADVVTMGVSRKTVAQGLVRDLAPLMEADAGFDPDDLLAGTLESNQWDGGTWALPTTVNFSLIYYDKDAFDEAGVPYPEPGWTWQDLALMAEALTVREGDETTTWGFVCSPSDAYLLIESRAGLLGDYSVTPPEPRFDRPAVVEALEWFAALRLDADAIPYTPASGSGSGSTLSPEDKLVDDGRAAIWPDYDALWSYRSMQGNPGVVPFPENADGSGASPALVSTLAMSAGTANPQAAWRWMAYLSRQAAGQIGQVTASLPVRRSLLDAEGFWDSVDAGLAPALRYAIDHAYIVRDSVGHAAMEQAVRSVLAGEATARDALVTAQELAKVEAEGAVAQASEVTPVPTFVVAPAKEETPSAAATTVISFMPGLGSLNMTPYRQLVREFEAANPDITVELKTLDLVSGTTPNLASMSTMADCFLWYPTRDITQLENLLELDSLADADIAFDIDDYYPQAVKQFTVNGRLWGLPADITPFIIEYNVDLFDAAGIAYPTNDWTWDDFLSIALALTEGEGEGKQYGFVAELYEATDVLLMLERLGARLIDDSVDPPGLSFNSPETIEAVEWYAALTTRHEVKPAYLTDITNLAGASSNSLDREAAINEGRAAMWTNVGTTAVIFGPRSGLSIGAVTLPARSDGTSAGSLLTTTGYFISAEAANREACWRWLTFLTGRPEIAQGLPARRSVAESEAYRDLVGPSRAEAYLSTVAEAAEPSSFQMIQEQEWLSYATLWLTQAYGQVLDGKATAAEALDGAQVMADNYRACMAAGDDYGTAASEACMRSTDPSMPAYIYTTAE